MRRFTIILISIIIYAGLSYLPVFEYITGTIGLFVTFLHEFGHAFFALVTGGRVVSLQVDLDGSGVTTTQGGNIALITMGGYIGSALFGNILMRATTNARSKVVLLLLLFAMITSAFVWYSTLTSSIIIVSYAIVLYLLCTTEAFPIFMGFLGVASVFHIIQDFNVGPSSDLAAYQKNVGILPYNAWMYVWLGLALLITVLNLVHIAKQKN